MLLQVLEMPFKVGFIYTLLFTNYLTFKGLKYLYGLFFSPAFQLNIDKKFGYFILSKIVLPLRILKEKVYVIMYRQLESTYIDPSLCEL